MIINNIKCIIIFYKKYRWGKQMNVLLIKIDCTSCWQAIKKFLILAVFKNDEMKALAALGIVCWPSTRTYPKYFQFKNQLFRSSSQFWRATVSQVLKPTASSWWIRIFNIWTYKANNWILEKLSLKHYQYLMKSLY